MSATEIASSSSRDELRGTSYEEGAAKLKPGDDPAAVEAERIKKAQASWEKLFGEKIGGELFALVRRHLSQADLTEYAVSGVTAMAKASGSLASPTQSGAAGGIMDTKKEAEALNKLIGALATDVSASAEKWLQSEKGQKVAAAISQWIEENPAWTTTIVATSAITAAVAAYLSNVDIPELEQTFKIGGGLSATAAVDFGKIQSMSLQAAKATLAYQTEGFEASITAAHDGEKDVNSVTAMMSGSAVLGRATSMSGKGDVVARDDGSLTLSASGNLDSRIARQPLRVEGGVSHTQEGGASTSERVTGTVRYGESGDHRELSGSYDRVSDTFTVSSIHAINGGATTRTDTVAQDGDGNITSSRQLDHRLDRHGTISLREEAGTLGTGSEASYKASDLGNGLALGLSAGTGTLAGYGANLDYKRGDIEAALNLEMRDQTSRLSVSAGATPDAGWSYSGNVQLNLSTSRLEELGASLGWQHPSEFKSFALDYKAKWLDTNPGMEHHFDATFEYAVGRVSGRLSGSMDLQGRTLMGTRADLLVGYQLDKDWMALGGVGYGGQRNADTHSLDGSLTYRTGVQYKDVAFTVGYTPDREEWGLQITIPLGKR